MDALDAAKDIYTYGFNAMDENGVITLANLSLDSFDLMKDDDWYNTYRFSFYQIGSKDEDEDPGEFDGEPVEHYADTVVDDLFDLNQDGIESEAALVMNVWMTVAHYLEDAARMCRAASSGGSVGFGEKQLDLAAAYWIGWGQETGEDNTGQLLYNLAEHADRRFGKDQDGSEVNKNVISLVNQMKSDIIDAGKCPSDYEKFRSLVHQTIAQMTVPLVQNLIHFMYSKKPKHLELYALAILPQIYACDTAAHDDLHKKLILNSYDSADFDQIVSDLQSLYSCLKITCADVGTYAESVVPQCNDETAPVLDLAGYSLSNDVRKVCRISDEVIDIYLLI